MGLRVLHAVESLNPVAGSVAIALPGLFRALRDNGLSSTVVTCDGSSLTSEHATVVGCDSSRVIEILADADVVHFHGLSSSLARLSRRGGKPYVISPLGALSRSSTGPNRKPSLGRRFSAWMDRRRVVRSAGAIAVLNDAEAAAIQGARHGATIQSLPYGLDFDEFAKPAECSADTLPWQDQRVLLVSTPIHPSEGLVSLLRAVAQLGQDFDGWQVVIAGPASGNWQRQLEAAVARKGASDRVTFVADPDAAAQSAWLARSSIVVSPHLYVRCPVGVMQALVAGVSAVASAHGLPDGLEQDCPGLSVYAPERDNIVSALRPLVQMSDDQRADIGARSRIAARSILDWSVLAPRYVELYAAISRTPEPEAACGVAS